MITREQSGAERELAARVIDTLLREDDASLSTVAFGLAGVCARNISHHGFLMHPEPGFRYVGTGCPPLPR